VSERSDADDPATARQPYTLVLHVEGAPTLDKALFFVERERMAPVAIGRRGVWHIDGPSVLDDHAFVGFDGAHVYMHSCDVRVPVRVGDVVLPSDRWTKVVPGSRIAFGGVTAVLRVLRGSIPPADAPAPLPRGQGRQGRRDDEATRIAPLAALAIPSDPVEVLGPPRSRVPAGASASSAPPPAHPAPMPSRPVPMPSRPVPAAAASREAPRDPAREAKTDVRPKDGAGEGGAQPGAKGRGKDLFLLVLLSVVAGSFVIPLIRARGASPIPEGRTHEVSATTVGSIVPTAALSAGIVVFPAPPRPPSRPDAGLSLEREAADAMHRGDLRAAAELYDRLSAGEPNQPAFGRAARILGRRMAEPEVAPEGTSAAAPSASPSGTPEVEPSGRPGRRRREAGAPVPRKIKEDGGTP
jgi:hypothetical protein